MAQDYLEGVKTVANRQPIVIGAGLLICLLWISSVSGAQRITTIAGGGSAIGTAKTAFFGYPGGVVRDGAGNTYISSNTDHYVYKLSTSGTVSVFAGIGYEGFSGDGGLATSASLNVPGGLAIDKAGNIYIADAGNNRIRKVAAGTGLISTVAGSGSANMFLQGGYGGDGGPATSALLNSPYSVEVDGLGNLLIADYRNFRIRKVDGKTGIITTIVGNGTDGFSGDGGLATNAEISYTLKVINDTSGGFYFADSGNNRIRHVDGNTQVIETVAGNGTSGFSGDGGLAVDAELSFPNSVVEDGLGNLYIIDTNNNRVRRILKKTQIISTVVGNGVQGFAGDGGPANKAEISDSSGAYLDNRRKELLIADSGTGRIRMVTLKGIINTLAGGGNAGDGGLATKARLAYPVAVALDSSGNLFIGQDTVIRKVNRSNGKITTVAGTGVEGFSGDGGKATQADFWEILGIAINQASDLFIADAVNERIRRVDHLTGIVSTIAGNGSACGAPPCGDGGLATQAALNVPASVAIDGNGNVYIADYLNSVIRRVDATTGIITTVAGNYVRCSSAISPCGDGGLAINANLSRPFGAAVDGAGNILIADSGDNRIRQVDARTGDISTVAFTGMYGFGGDGGLALNAIMARPLAVALDSSDNIFVSGGYNSGYTFGGGYEVVRRIDASTRIITTVAGQDTNPTVFGFSGDGGLATNATLNNLGIAIDSAGNLYIADAGNNRVRKVGP